MNKELRKSIDEEQLKDVTGGGAGTTYVDDQGNHTFRETPKGRR